MLATLRIKNLAIVDDLAIEFQPGLNVLTGETGAGKSIVLKAIGLLIGGRAGTELIRHGADRCEVEGLFLITGQPKEMLISDHPNLENSLVDDELLIRRVIDSGGRSRFSVNGQLVTRSEVEELGKCLVDLTGQHEQHRLLDPTCQRELLDEFGVSGVLLEEMRVVYAEYARLRDRLEDVRRNAEKQEEYLRRIRDEHEELSRVGLRQGEREELEIELKRLSHTEVLREVVGQTLQLLDGDGEHPGVISHLNRVLTTLDSGVRYDEHLGEIRALVETSQIHLGEAQLAADRYLSRLELDPEEVEKVRERLAEIARLERKYQQRVPELIAYSARLGEELAQAEAGAFDEAKLAGELAERERALRALEKELTDERRNAGERLAKFIEQELLDLNMKAARFKVELTPAPSSPVGADAVAFLLSANPGEPLRPLTKVASGGELSRLLLVLKTLLRERNPPLLQVFDEVDAGIGGAVAQVVGERLKRLSEGGQVLIITHAPQIAALAGAHFVVAKRVDEERTCVSVNFVEGEKRVREIARMLAGKKVTENFEDSARELLDLAQPLFSQMTAPKGR